MQNTPIKDRMTSAPITVEETTSLKTAEQLIRRYNIRHLPTVKDGKLSGIVYSRDIESVLKIPSLNHERETIEALVDKHVPHASPDAPLKEVLQEMVQKKYEVVVVSHQGNIQGVFTFIDVTNLLIERLDRE